MLSMCAIHLKYGNNLEYAKYSLYIIRVKMYYVAVFLATSIMTLNGKFSQATWPGQV